MKNLLNSLRATRDDLTAQICAAYDAGDLDLQDTLCNARTAIDAITDDLQGL
jgi:hypothetical protein